MDGSQLLLELIKLTDMKIDLMEYVIEKMDLLSKSEQRQFVKSSKVFDKIDWLNMEFIAYYQRFLKAEGIKDISQANFHRLEGIRDLKHLVAYALELETCLDDTLSKL